MYSSIRAMDTGVRCGCTIGNLYPPKLATCVWSRLLPIQQQGPCFLSNPKMLPYSCGKSRRHVSWITSNRLPNVSSETTPRQNYTIDWCNMSDRSCLAKTLYTQYSLSLLIATYRNAFNLIGSFGFKANIYTFQLVLEPLEIWNVWELLVIAKTTFKLGQIHRHWRQAQIWGGTAAVDQEHVNNES